MKPTSFTAAALLLGTAIATGAQQSSVAGHDCHVAAPAIDHAAMDHAGMDHTGMQHAAVANDPCSVKKLPTSSGQAAYGTISEIVRMLDADPSTDWTKVNIEALRQHLIDMDDVTLRSIVSQRNVDGGFEADVTGTGHTGDAIRRMTKNHASMMNAGVRYQTTVADIPNGVRIRVTAKDPSNGEAVARVRSLGFAGILTEGDHHAAHHLALALGEKVHEP